MKRNAMDIVQVGNVLLSIECFEEHFACDLGTCRGCCCIEGDAGAPVTPDEVMAIEDIIPDIVDDLSPEAVKILEEQGVAYIDEDGDLVTSIVGGKDCIFTCYDEKGTCLCAIEKAQREGHIKTSKPISCWLYPLRLKEFKSGMTGVNYHRWDICQCGRDLGQKLKFPLYKFLREPLIARFGENWYRELEETARQLRKE